MLQMTRPPAHRFPPLPFITQRPKITPADRAVIRLALRSGDYKLPTDWPDLESMMQLLDEVDRPLPEGIRARRRDGAA
jgi:hypothetical protein